MLSAWSRALGNRVRAWAASERRSLCEKAGQVGAGVDARMHMVFTCAKCETRAVKSFSKRAYEHGVVIATCPGCESRHLIADNLGWFGEERNIEEILRKKGVRVPIVSEHGIEYAPNQKVVDAQDGSDSSKKTKGDG